MEKPEWLAEQFEANRTHLRSVAYRMLGSLAEADDAVQESWLHVSRAGTSGVMNLGGWLTTSRSGRLYGSAEYAVPAMLIQRVLAPNPGPMTLTGTNTYVVGDGSGNLAVIDPGPDEPRHLTAILDAARPLGTITTVLVTHRHGDHLPAAIPLCERTGARLAGHADLPGVQQPV